MAEKKENRTYLDLVNENQVKNNMPMLGDYPESTGGGTPMEEGEDIDFIAETTQEAEEYKKDYPDAVVRVKQPRNPKSGRFERNAANLRALKYKPSRAKSLPSYVLNMPITFSKAGKGSIVDAQGHKFVMPEGITNADEYTDWMVDSLENNPNELKIVPKGKGGKTPRNVEHIGIGMKEFIAVNDEQYQYIKSTVRNRNLFNTAYNKLAA